VHYLTTGPADARCTFLFVHGAGGAMDTQFMNRIAEGVGARGIRVVRFEFPYMAARRAGGGRGAPDRAPVLLECWRRAIADHDGTDSRIVIGGKSMGGRMASLIADEAGAAALVCFGYPFHPPGKPQQLRTAHLEAIRTPTLILQGERDPFGTPDEVASYALSSSVRIECLTDGDHSLKPRKSSGVTEQENLEQAAHAAAEFIRSVEA
jgi:uncharacterized protein